MGIFFDDGKLADRCNGKTPWPGSDVEDVHLALLVLHESPNLQSFLSLPNTQRERDEIVFEGRNTSVVLTASQEEDAVLVREVSTRKRVNAR